MVSTGRSRRRADLRKTCMQKWKIKLSQQLHATVGELWSPVVATGPPPVFINEVLLEHSQAHSFTHSRAAFTPQGQLSSCNTIWLVKPKSIYYLIPYRKSMPTPGQNSENFENQEEKSGFDLMIMIHCRFWNEKTARTCVLIKTQKKGKEKEGHYLQRLIIHKPFPLLSNFIFKITNQGGSHAHL